MKRPSAFIFLFSLLSLLSCDMDKTPSLTREWAQQAYIKAVNNGSQDYFGSSVAISDDTIVVGAYGEDSNQTTITNDASASSDDSLHDSGAAYVYKRTGNAWAQEGYIKAVNNDSWDYFGSSVAISGDTIIVGAYGEKSNQTTITNGASASSDNSINHSGAVYVYKLTASGWVQEAYIKAANADTYDQFGKELAIDGDTVVVGASLERSNQTAITNGPTASSDNSLEYSGAAYVYRRTGSAWIQEAYIKAGNADAHAKFGCSVDIDGDTIVIGSSGEKSNQTTITNGQTTSSDRSNPSSGAAYVYRRAANAWEQEAYIKAGNNESALFFGSSVAIAGDTIAVGAYGESSNQTAITNGMSASNDHSSCASGAVYVYKRTGNAWIQEAYIKAANGDAGDRFGEYPLAIDGDTIAVGAPYEASRQTYIINGSGASPDNSSIRSGAVYVYRRSGSSWAQEAFIKAANSEDEDFFGYSTSMAGNTIVVSAPYEFSSQNYITNGPQATTDDSQSWSGAVFVYRLK